MTMIDEIRTAYSPAHCASARQLSPLTLALIGDAVFSLYARALLIDQSERTPRQLHFAASKFVCAAGQSAAAKRIEPLLTEEELGVYRRGRNAHSGSIPKNASVADYHAATGIEALAGWLFLSGADERLSELMGHILESEAT